MATSHWGLVIKTNEYAGNFERALCAHCTGIVGECGVGGDYINEENRDLFENEDEDCIINLPDERGCRRPCEIWMAEDSQYTSVIIYFEKKPSQRAIDIIKSRAKTFLDVVKEKNKHLYGQWKDFQILGFSLIEFKSDEVKIEI